MKSLYSVAPTCCIFALMFERGIVFYCLKFLYRGILTRITILDRSHIYCIYALFACCFRVKWDALSKCH